MWIIFNYKIDKVFMEGGINVTFRINKNNAQLIFDYDSKSNWSSCIEDYSSYKMLRSLLTYMGSIGFYVVNDKTVSKIIRKGYFYGHYKELEFKSHVYLNGFEFKFFQSTNDVNYNDFSNCDKLNKMSYLTKLEFIKTINKISNFLIEQGAKETINNKWDSHKYAVDKIKSRYVDSWHKPQKNMNFNLSDIDGTTESESYNIHDRDKKMIYNGNIKYFRDYSGTLKRGKVYHNINNMWWVIVDKYTVRNITSFELFDANVNDFKRRRLAPDKTPREYIEKQRIISQMTFKELEREINHRLKNKEGK